MLDGKKIQGDPPSILKYICLVKKLDVFYPENQRSAIDTFLEYSEQVVNRCTSRLTKLVTQQMMVNYDEKYENAQIQLETKMKISEFKSKN